MLSLSAVTSVVTYLQVRWHSQGHQDQQNRQVQQIQQDQQDQPPLTDVVGNEKCYDLIITIPSERGDLTTTSSGKNMRIDGDWTWQTLWRRRLTAVLR
jgi:hypothetical protein